MPFLQKFTKADTPPLFRLQDQQTAIVRSWQTHINRQGKEISRVHAVSRCEGKKYFPANHSARKVTTLNRQRLKTERRWQQSNTITIGSAEPSIPDVNALDMGLTSLRDCLEVIPASPASSSITIKAAGKHSCVKPMMNTLRRLQIQRQATLARDLRSRHDPISKGSKASIHSQKVSILTVPIRTPQDKDSAAIQRVTATGRDRLTRFDPDRLIVLGTVSFFIIPLVQELLSHAGSGKPADSQP